MTKLPNHIKKKNSSKVIEIDIYKFEIKNYKNISNSKK